ncbi:MAG: metallophosphoesterase, partial [Nodosilinea sp.]
ADEIITRLEAAGVRLMFTGHLHVQDVARRGELCEVLTGSLVSYPHPYRIVEIEHGAGDLRMEVRSRRLTAVHPWDDLQAMSHKWMSDRAEGFMTKFLISPPVGLAEHEAAAIAPTLKGFWASIAAGDPQIDFSHLPPEVQRRLEHFNSVDSEGNPQAIDNTATLVWSAT